MDSLKVTIPVDGTGWQLVRLFFFVDCVFNTMCNLIWWAVASVAYQPWSNFVLFRFTWSVASSFASLSSFVFSSSFSLTLTFLMLLNPWSSSSFHNRCLIFFYVEKTWSFHCVACYFTSQSERWEIFTYLGLIAVSCHKWSLFPVHNLIFGW